jgi:hypothetical protein
LPPEEIVGPDGLLKQLAKRLDREMQGDSDRFQGFDGNILFMYMLPYGERIEAA